MAEGCLAKQYAQKHFNEELKIGIQHTPTRSPFDGRQNFVSRHICRHPTCVETSLVNPMLHPGIVDVEFGPQLQDCVLTLYQSVF